MLQVRRAQWSNSRICCVSRYDADSVLLFKVDTRTQRQVIYLGLVELSWESPSTVQQKVPIVNWSKLTKRIREEVFVSLLVLYCTVRSMNWFVDLPSTPISPHSINSTFMTFSSLPKAADYVYQVYLRIFVLVKWDIIVPFQSPCSADSNGVINSTLFSTNMLRLNRQQTSRVSCAQLISFRIM